MLVEILPNARGPLIVDLFLRMGYTTIAIGVLGFLGIGLPPPDPDWGGMVKETYGMIFGLAAHGADSRRRRSPRWSSASISSPTACGRSRAMADDVSRSRASPSSRTAAVMRAAAIVITGVSFDLVPGEAFGLVGESGCGKSTSRWRSCAIWPPGMTSASGRILFEGRTSPR